MIKRISTGFVAIIVSILIIVHFIWNALEEFAPSLDFTLDDDDKD